MWNSKRTALTSFRTEFVLNILPQNGSAGEGMAFMLTNNPSLPSNSSGQWLGLFNNQTDGAFTNRMVAVEFDTRKSYQEDLDDNHVGIDINSIKSNRQYPLSNQSIVLASGSDVWVQIKYNGTSLLFQVTLIQYSTSGQHVTVASRYIDLSLGLLDDIYLGFAGSTGDFTQLNQIKSWKFTTVDDDVKVGTWRKVLLALATVIIFSTCLFAVLFMWRRLTRHRRLAYCTLENLIDADGPASPRASPSTSPPPFAVDLSGFEFGVAIHLDSWEKQRLPDKFARVLDGQEPREVKLREASGGRRIWSVEVLFDCECHMYLHHGWELFARAHDLQVGHFLVFNFDGHDMLTVKIFDGTMCRRYYHTNDDEEEE